MRSPLLPIATEPVYLVIAPAGFDEQMAASRADEARRRSARLVTYSIMAGVAVWGTLHAVGAYGYNHNPLRAVVVLACTFGFLGFWGLALRTSRARAKKAHR